MLARPAVPTAPELVGDFGYLLRDQANVGRFVAHSNDQMRGLQLVRSHLRRDVSGLKQD